MARVHCNATHVTKVKTSHTNISQKSTLLYSFTKRQTFRNVTYLSSLWTSCLRHESYSDSTTWSNEITPSFTLSFSLSGYPACVADLLSPAAAITKFQPRVNTCFATNWRGVWSFQPLFYDWNGGSCDHAVPNNTVLSYLNLGITEIQMGSCKITAISKVS